MSKSAGSLSCWRQKPTSFQTFLSYSFLDASIAKEFNKCIELSKKSIELSIKRGLTLPDNNIENADLVISLRNGGMPATSPKFLGIEHEGFDCSVKKPTWLGLRNVRKGSQVKLKAEPMIISCVRNASTEGKDLTIVINTNVDTMDVNAPQTKPDVPIFPVHVRGQSSLSISAHDLYLTAEIDRSFFHNDNRGNKAGCIISKKGVVSAYIQDSSYGNRTVEMDSGKREVVANVGNSERGHNTKCTIVDQPSDFQDLYLVGNKSQ